MFSFQSKPSARPSFEDVFFKHHGRLYEWAVQLTSGDHSNAEDLIQELFIRVAEVGSVGDHIENAESYLFSMLRNLHYARIRRARTSAIDDLSILDYDSAQRSLRAVDRNGILFIREDLHRVCDYLCERKESSRAASIFLLRYFLGYFPQEILQVTQSTPVAIRKALQAIRREVRLELERPGVLQEIGTKRVSKPRASLESDDARGLFVSLWTKIFQSGKGSCFDPAVLESRYARQVQPLDIAELAHIVACRRCLDRVNHLLGLPLLEERSPDEVIRRDPPSGRAGSSANGSPKLASNRPRRKSVDTERVRQQMKRSLEEVKQHLPHRLFIAVDGNLRASQAITAEHSEQNVDLNPIEKPLFIEVLSEQDICLGFMPVRERNSEGGLFQSVEVKLSDGRTLVIAISFVSESPTIQVVYDDPLFNQASSFSNGSFDGEEAAYFYRNNDAMPEDTSGLFGSWQTVPSHSRTGFGRWLTSLFPLEMNPLLTSAVLLGLSSIICFLLWTREAPKISADALLHRAAQSEAITTSASGPGVIRQQVRIRATGHTLDRVIYRDVQRKRQPVKQKLDADSQWLKERLAQAGVDWDEPLSVVSYASWHDRLLVRKDVVSGVGDHLLRLTTFTEAGGAAFEESLTVRDSDFHPVERTITLKDAGEVQIAEVSYNLFPWSSANENWFEPAPTTTVSDASDMHAAVRLPHVLPDFELDEAELAARNALNQLQADTGETIRLVREQRSIEVKGVVDTDVRKRELLSHLALLPNVHASILSGEELGTRLPSRIASGAGQVIHTYSAQELPSPLQQYVHDKALSMDQLTSTSQDLQDGSLRIMQLEAHLTELRSRFGGASQLPAELQNQMGVLSHNYIASIIAGIEINRQTLLTLGFVNPNRSSTTLASNDAEKDIAEEIRRYRKLCMELVSNETGQTRPAPEIAGEIFDVGDRIRLRITKESGTVLQDHN